MLAFAICSESNRLVLVVCRRKMQKCLNVRAVWVIGNHLEAGSSKHPEQCLAHRKYLFTSRCYYFQNDHSHNGKTRCGYEKNETAWPRGTQQNETILDYMVEEGVLDKGW